MKANEPAFPVEFEKELRIDSYTNSSPQVKMRVTHIPTGISANGIGINTLKLRYALTANVYQNVNESE